MIGNSMPDEEFIKLSHFDRVRRSYFDKIPLNFMLIGVTMGINVFSFIIGMVMLVTLLKEKFRDKDDMELKQHGRQIEFQKREQYI